MLDYVVIFDVDGVVTPGTFFYSKEGKVLKRFGPDDWDAVREMSKYVAVHFITADKKGYPIVEKRIKEEMKFSLDLVPNKPPYKRWEWIKETYPNKKIVYVADGIYDWYCLKQADWGIVPAGVLEHIRLAADWQSSRRGGDRFVAEACLEIMRHLKVGNWPYVGMENFGG